MNPFLKSIQIAKCTMLMFTRIPCFSIFSLIVLILSFKITAKEKINFTYYIEWQNVVGAKGYIIQIKDKSVGTEKEEKLNQNNVELKLPAGYYEFRISSVNKFGKPSAWTSWEEFYVEKDKPKPLKKGEKVIEEKKEPERVAKEIKKWKWFIPGLVQYQSNQKLYSGLWIFWFTALTVYGNSERVAGNNLASDNLNNPLFLSILASKTPIVLDLYLREQREAAKGEYVHHQSNQVAVGIVAILSYALQVWHGKRVSEKGNISIELNSRSQRFAEMKGQMDNPLMTFELKISMRY